jgi:flavin-dependent dehydrogenase
MAVADVVADERDCKNCTVACREGGTLTSTDYDTIVVGAGPAGIMAARAAAARGSVLILDTASLPREKSCGGMLNEYAQDFLSDEGMPRELVLDPEYVHFRYWDWDRDIRKPTELRFHNVDRRGFDEWLTHLLPSNVEIEQRTSLVGLSHQDGTVAATLKNGGDPFELTCNNLVGADGARSAVRRTLGIGSVATYVTVQDFVQLEERLDPFFDCIYMRGIGDSYAYSYVVPKGEQAIVGSVFYPHTRKPHERHEQAVAAIARRLPIGGRAKREAGVALHVRSAQDVVAGHGNVVLAGEAGGFMSPTSGEGISYAMNSGHLAGASVAGNAPGDVLASYRQATEDIAGNIRRKLRWLPFMESRLGKYLSGFVPTPVVSRVTKGL